MTFGKVLLHFVGRVIRVEENVSDTESGQENRYKAIIRNDDEDRCVLIRLQPLETLTPGMTVEVTERKLDAAAMGVRTTEPDDADD